MIAAVDANPAAWFDLLSGQPGARVGSCWVVTGVPFPLCNSVLFPPASAALVDEALLAGRGVPQLWWLGSSPAGVLSLLDERGVVVDEEELPGMALDLSSASLPAVSTPLRIETGGLTDFAVPFGAAYGFTDAALGSVLAGFRAYRGADVQHFVGYDGDAPVACASIVVRDGVCGLYDVGTVDAARGQGHGTALTVHALRAGVAMGARLAILHSSPSGMPIYRRLGFEIVTTARTVETRQA